MPTRGPAPLIRWYTDVPMLLVPTGKAEHFSIETELTVLDCKLNATRSSSSDGVPLPTTEQKRSSSIQ